MLGHMDTLVKSFEEPGTDYAAAEEAIRTFLMQGGFSLFDDFGEEVPGHHRHSRRWVPEDRRPDGLKRDSSFVVKRQDH